METGRPSSEQAQRVYLSGIEAAKAEQGIRAARLWKECLRLNPDHAEALANLGWHKQSHYRPRSAIAYYRRALALRPDWDRVAASLVNCYRLAGDRTAARAAAKEGLRHNPGSAKIRAALLRAQWTFFVRKCRRLVSAIPVVGAGLRVAPVLWRKAVLLTSSFSANLLEGIQYRRKRGYTTAVPREEGFRLHRYIIRERRRWGWRSPVYLSYSRAIEFPLVTQAMGPLRGKEVLDIGAADCPISLDWSRLGARVACVDPSEIIARLRGHPAYQALPVAGRPRLARGDGCFLPFRDESFDVVVSISTLEHIPDDGDIQVVRESARVLRPGGRLVLTVEAGPQCDEKWVDVNITGLQYASVKEENRHLADSDPDLLVRTYTLEAVRERLLEPSGLVEIDCGIYDDVLFRGRDKLEGDAPSVVKTLFRDACQLAAQLNYRRLPPGRKPKPTAIAFLVAQRPS